MWRFDIIYSDPFWSRYHISSVWISHYAERFILQELNYKNMYFRRLIKLNLKYLLSSSFFDFSTWFVPFLSSFVTLLPMMISLFSSSCLISVTSHSSTQFCFSLLLSPSLLIIASFCAVLSKESVWSFMFKWHDQ